MIQRHHMKEVLRLHEKSYRLLRWVNQRFRSGNLKLSAVHEDISFVDAAEDWISHWHDSLPNDSRPEKGKLRPFASLFVSYLRTSFEPAPSGPRLSFPCCGCTCCSYLVNVAAHLKPRKLTKKSKAAAAELKNLYVQKLLEELAKDSSPAVVAALIEKSSDLGRQIALATYGHELIRRSEFASQGEGVYALWREFAWEKSGPKPGFKLTVDMIIDAQDDILDCIRTGDKA